MSAVFRIVQAMRPDPARVAAAVLAGTAATAAGVALLATSGWLISRAAQQPPVMYLMVAVVSVRALGIGRGVLRYAERLAGHDVALRGVVTLREGLYRSLSLSAPGAAAGLRRGDLLARLGADVDTVADVVTRALLPFAVALVSGIGAVVALALILPGAGVVLALALVLTGVLVPALYARAAQKAERAAAGARAELTARTQSIVDSLTELTVAGVAPDRLTAIRSLDASTAQSVSRAQRPAAIAAALSTLTAGVAVLGCLVLGELAVAEGRMGSVMLAVVVLLPMAAMEITSTLPGAAAALVRGGIAAQRLVPLLECEQVYPDTPEAPHAHARARLRLTTRGLACGWPGRSPLLDDVRLDLQPGSRVAFVGPSGSGKSTLLMTLAGLIPPAAGQLDVRTPAGDEVPLRPAVLFTADDAHIFETTLRENLRLPDPRATDEQLIDALETAGLAQWFAGLPDGLDSLPVASAGERRRLLLARAILSPAPIILLDEPSEHLDNATADALMREVLSGSMFGDRTVVVATHRAADLRSAEEILVIQNGRLRSLISDRDKVLQGGADLLDSRPTRYAFASPTRRCPVTRPTSPATPSSEGTKRAR